MDGSRKLRSNIGRRPMGAAERSEGAEDESRLDWMCVLGMRIMSAVAQKLVEQGSNLKENGKDEFSKLDEYFEISVNLRKIIKQVSQEPK